MARLPTHLPISNETRSLVSHRVISHRAASAYPRMTLKSCNNLPISHQLLTVTGLIFITVALCFDYSILGHLKSNISAPFRFTPTVHLNTPTMPSSKPPSKKRVGHAGWTLIHSIAANYPHNPSANEQYHAKAFLRSIGKLYPCKRCRQHFEKYMAASPPDLSSRDQFVLWACRAHNAVNRRQGKQEFNCNVKSLDQRWGDCGCQLKSSTKK